MTRSESVVEASAVLCVVLGRGRGAVVGFAALDAHRGSLRAGQFADTPMLAGLCREIHLAQPSLLVAGCHGAGGLPAVPAALSAAVDAAFPDLVVKCVPRSMTDARRGAAIFAESGAGQPAEDSFYMYSAVAGLYAFMDGCGSPLGRDVRVVRSAAEGSLLVDVAAARALELVSGAVPGARSLLDAVDTCATPMGRRALRSTILQPPSDLPTICARQDAVERLAAGGLHEALRDALAPMGDAEAALASVLRPSRAAGPAHAHRVCAAALSVLRALDAGRSAALILAEAGIGVESRDEGSGGFDIQTGDKAGVYGVAQPAPTLDRIPNGQWHSLGSSSTDCNIGDSCRKERGSTASDNQVKSFTNQCDARVADKRIPTLLAGLTQALDCAALAQLKERLRSAIDEEVCGARPNEHAACHVIRAAGGTLLDVARRALDEATSDVLEYAAGVGARVRYATGRGFVLTLETDAVGGDANVGDGAISCHIEDEHGQEGSHGRALTKGKVVRVGRRTATTLELEQLNIRVREAMAEVAALTEEAADGVVASVRAAASPLWALCEAAAALDVLCALARLPGVRPEFGDAVAVVDARCPLLADARPLSYAAGRDSRLVVLTGAANAGKTTLLRTAGTLQVLAQAGARVPAAHALLAAVCALRVRMGCDDAPGTSSFGVEMRDAAALLQESRPCLALIDELGRGTAPAEGAAILAAVCERLLRAAPSQDCAFAFVATHMLAAADYVATFPGAARMDLGGNGEPHPGLRAAAAVAPGAPWVRAVAAMLGCAATGAVRGSRGEDGTDADTQRWPALDDDLEAVRRAAEKRRLVVRTAHRAARVLEAAGAGNDAAAVDELRGAFLRDLEGLSCARMSVRGAE